MILSLLLISGFSSVEILQNFPTVSRDMKGSVFIATTMDGFVATPEGGVEFLDEFQTDENQANDFGFGDFLSSIDVIIMGRNSFEKVLSFGETNWVYGSIPVIVWSRSGVPIPKHLKDTVSSCSLPPTELFRLLQEQNKQHAYIDGGYTVQRFLQEDLIDQIILTRVPILLGEGISLFGNLGRTIYLNHEATDVLSNGLVKSCYQVVKQDSIKR
jgi:dihydrofolate reductase